MAKRKPWRKFRKKKAVHKHIRRICLAMIGAELLVLKGQNEIRLPAVEVSADSREIVIYRIPEEDGSGLPVPYNDRVYGIRIRLKDGVVDFYRREELYEYGQ